jgi:hypothetical protein
MGRFIVVFVELLRVYIENLWYILGILGRVEVNDGMTTNMLL